MAFTLIEEDGRADHGDDARYSFTQSGLLVVHDGKGKKLTYSPGAWKRIEEAEKPPSDPSSLGRIR